MKYFRQLISAVTLLILASAVPAQTTETSSNLITNPTFNGISGWTVQGMTGGVASVRPDGYTSSLGGYTFSYQVGNISQTYAINQALSAAGTGLQIQGFDYGFQYQIWCTNQSGLDCTTGSVGDSFAYSVSITNSAGQYIYTNVQDLSGGLMSSPASIDVQQRFANPLDVSTLGNFSISFSGRDDGFWGGNYGPSVSNVYSRAVYGIDPCVSNSQSSPSCPGYKTFYTIPDDGHAIVPIPFGFPFYGQVFTHSIFFDNGAVSFYSPNNPSHPQRMAGGGLGGFALNESLPSSFFYTIMPLRTDLIANQGRHYTQGDLTYLRYTWEDVSQFGRWDSRNTFSLEIRPTGYIGIQYDKIDLTSSWTSAIIGNASLGEYQLIQSQSNWGVATTSIDNWSINNTTGTDCSDPLNHPNCPGHREAYVIKNVINSNPSSSGSSIESMITQEPEITQRTTSAIVETTAAQETVDVIGIESNVLQDLVIAQLLTNETTSTDIEADLTEDKENEMSLESLLSSPTPTPQPTSTATPSSRETANAAPTTTRQAIAQQRQAAAREQAAQEARDDPEGTSEAMDSAESMEQQIEIQNAVLGAMSFVPGFDAYGRITLPDAVGYAPFEIYSGQRNIDTPAARGLLRGSDRLHQEMVNEQWNR